MDTTPFTATMRPFMERVLREIGPRPPCSAPEQRLGALLQDDWQTFCDQVDIHSFHCHPRALLGWIPWIVAAYLAVLVSYWLLPPLAFVLAAGSCLVLLLQGLRFRELLDRLFPQAEGRNVVGVLRPRGEIERRIVLMAHQDSAYEYTLWRRFGNLSLPIMLLAGFAFLWMLGGSLAAALAWALGDTGHVAFTIIGIVGLALYPPVGLFVFLTVWTPVPGAMDNLSGVAVISALGKAAAQGGEAGERLLEGSELILLATSSEEAGLRGSRRFVQRHAGRLERIPTYDINLDGIGDPQHLAFIDRELWLGVRHDEDLASLGMACAEAEGLEAKRITLPMGGTDAASFTQAKLPATTIICQDSGRLIPSYHTRDDTLDNMDPAALDTAFRLVLAMLHRIDTGVLEPARDIHSWGAEATPVEPPPAPTALRSAP
jgi:hypothetical protein